VEGARKNASGGSDSALSSGVGAGGYGEPLSLWPLARGIEGYCDKIRDSLFSQANSVMEGRKHFGPRTLMSLPTEASARLGCGIKSFSVQAYSARVKRE
jgi:hypothetical protein